MKKRSNLTWSRIKVLLGARKDASLVTLLHALYEQSEENRDFIEASVVRDESTFRPYLEAVESALSPDVYRNQPLRLGYARHAISTYRRATGDNEGTLELMLRYVECGTSFTAEFGDIDEAFYSSLCSMFDQILRVVSTLSPGEQKAPIERLSGVVEQAGAVGWGYQDYIGDALERALPQPADRD